MALIVYNEDEDDYIWTIKVIPETQVTIPVVGVLKSQGERMLRLLDGPTVEITKQTGYTFAQGTSFAAPYVTGAIAALWSACTRCDKEQVIECLQITALDVGEQGRDDKFGYGVIQTGDAYKCLQQREKCC